MKKLFTLIAMACMALGANAQSTDKTWNFSSWETGDIAETKTIDGLTVYAESGKAVTISGSNKTVNEVDYKQVLKLGGSAGLTSRRLEFAVDGPCTLEIVLCTASAGSARTLNIYKNVDATGEAKISDYVDGSVPANELTLETYNYTGEAATLSLGSANSGINIYAIYVKYQSSDPTAIQNVNAVVESNGKAYNLGGRVATKGLLIQNGKKIIK